MPLPDEVDITPVIEQAIRDRKEVALPVIDGSQMIFRRVDTLWKGKLKAGALNVSEPIDTCNELVAQQQKEGAHHHSRQSFQHTGSAVGTRSRVL